MSIVTAPAQDRVGRITLRGLLDPRPARAVALAADTAVAREMALFRINAAADNRAEIIEFTQIFRAHIVDVSRRSITVEVTGTTEKIDSFERMVRPHGLIEMARTGEVAIARARPES